MSGDEKIRPARGHVLDRHRYICDSHPAVAARLYTQIEQTERELPVKEPFGIALENAVLRGGQIKLLPNSLAVAGEVKASDRGRLAPVSDAEPVVFFGDVIHFFIPLSSFISAA